MPSKRHCTGSGSPRSAYWRKRCCVILLGTPGLRPAPIRLPPWSILILFHPFLFFRERHGIYRLGGFQARGALGIARIPRMLGGTRPRLVRFGLATRPVPSRVAVDDLHV